MTLTEAAFWTKRLGVIALGVLAVISIIVILLFQKISKELPIEYQQPNFACTETASEFLENVLTIPSYDLKSESNPEYVVQTDTGKLDDDLPDIINVYKYEDLGERIDAQARAKILATQLGFDKDAIKRQQTSEYLWQDEASQRGLRVNVRDLNFTFSTSVEKIRSIRANAGLPSESEAINLAKKALSGLSLYLEDYNEVTPLVYLIDIGLDGTYTEADSLGSAELIRVDFIRKFPMITIPSNIQNGERMVKSLERRNMEAVVEEKTINDEKVNIYNFKTFLTHQITEKSNVSVYIGPENEDVTKLKNVYQIDYKVWSIEEESCGTYPLISAAAAEEKIKNGQGSLALLNYNGDKVAPYSPQEVKKFIVTSITLTYYEGLLEQKFLQPVYFFSGEAELANGKKADFDIYYPAISYENVGDKVILKEAPPSEKGPFDLF